MNKIDAELDAYEGEVKFDWKQDEPVIDLDQVDESLRDKILGAWRNENKLDLLQKVREEEASKGSLPNGVYALRDLPSSVKTASVRDGFKGTFNGRPKTINFSDLYIEASDLLTGGFRDDYELRGELV